MTAETRLGLGVLGGAVVLGLVGDALFQGQSLGLNVPLWVAAFTVVLAVLVRFGRVPWHQGRRWMIAPLLGSSALFVWHDAPLLVATNMIALAAAIALGSLRRPSSPPYAAGIADYVGGLVAAGCATVAGALPAIDRDIVWRDVAAGARRGRLLAVARGLVIAAPLVILFGGLFVAADVVFKAYVVDAVPSGPELPIRAGLILAWSWLAAGLLRDLVAAREDARVVSPAAMAQRTPRITLGATEVLVALGLLDLLFLAFVLVQLRYLFGGKGLVEAHAHLTYAAYARHGFFELVAVSALALPVLLLADWTLRREGRRHDALFRIFSGVLVALVFVVMVSALQRMRLYEQVYGLTELRLYATGLILWLAAVFGWFVVTVLVGRRRLFAVGALAAGFAATLGLNVVNPDALIARTNLDRPRADIGYLATLSDDAVPTLLRRLPRLSPSVRRQLAQSLLRRGTGSVDWRSWTVAKRDARALLAEQASALRVFAQPPAP
jgi:hypothetical protein